MHLCSSSWFSCNLFFGLPIINVHASLFNVLIATCIVNHYSWTCVHCSLVYNTLQCLWFAWLGVSCVIIDMVESGLWLVWFARQTPKSWHAIVMQCSWFAQLFEVGILVLTPNPFEIWGFWIKFMFLVVSAHVCLFSMVFPMLSNNFKFKYFWCSNSNVECCPTNHISWDVLESNNMGEQRNLLHVPKLHFFSLWNLDINLDAMLENFVVMTHP